jgi:acyl-homoserine-lactone acylase
MAPPQTTARLRAARLLLLTALLAALAATVTACGDNDTQPVAATAGHRYRVEIRRTQYGIPHIRARDYGSLGYGYGYAFAQDNACVMADRVLTLRGERSRYLGATASSNDPFAPDEGPSTNLASDVYYKGLREAGVVRRLLARPAPLGPTARLRRLVDGYVAGFNRYLRATGVARLPDPTCRGKAWVRPIAALDVWSGIYDLNLLSGTAQFRDAIVSARPRAGAQPERHGPTGRPDRTGSNGWALGRAATRRHDGMLLANPHFPWSDRARFYQVQLTIPGALNVAGASVAGTPVVEIGHNRGVAWTHTTSTAQRFTLFQLELVPGTPTSYRVDGRAVAMSRQKVTVTVRAADGDLSTVTRTVYGSRFGPVLATGWSDRTAFAIRDANAGNLRSMNEWLAMGRARNTAELRAAQDAYQGIPWMNTLAVDARGTAYFADASVVPNVTDTHAGRCRGSAEAPDPEILILDGSRSACDWGHHPGAVERGIFGPRRVPHLTRADYVANSNDGPWLTNPAAPITGYPAIFGESRGERSLRTRLGLAMIAERLDGSDGLGRPGFTLTSLAATMLGDRNYSAELGRSDVVAMCRAHPVLTASDGTRVDVRAACTLLGKWDGRADSDRRAEMLWERFFQDRWWRIPYDPAHPLTTPRGIDADKPDVQRALADAVQSMTSDPAAASARRWAGIPLPGCPGEKGCFNVIESDRSENASEPQLFGSSFIMAVELTPRGPRSRTLLTYSESANPASPHHRDQTILFARKHWVTERFSETDIKADPRLQTTRLRG